MNIQESIVQKYNIPSFSEFNYWFIRSSLHFYDVYQKIGDEWRPLGESVIDRPKDIDDRAVAGAVWVNDWIKFTSRPEYIVTCAELPEYARNLADADKYELYLVGCAFLRAGKDFKHNPDTAWTKLEHIIEWVRSTDFYQAPASTQYHESILGGLCLHTLRVVNRIKDLIDCKPFKSVDIGDAVLVALVHDWCKIGLYESYMRNVKDDNTGVWHQVPSFKTKSPRFSSFGHGVSSMFLASKFFQLSQEEALAIRWHQGRWNCCREEMNELQQSNETFPLVHLLQFADQLAIVKY